MYNDRVVVLPRDGRRHTFGGDATCLTLLVEHIYFLVFWPRGSSLQVLGVFAPEVDR